MHPISRRTALATLSSACALLAGRRPMLAAPLQATAPGGTLAERLAAYAAALRVADLSPGTIEAVKFSVIDSMGCAIGAFNEEPVKAVRTLALGAGSGAATLVGTARTSNVELAAFANAVAVRWFDFNDVYASKETGHPSDIISGVLAVAEAEGRTGLDVVLAVALAYEVNCQLLDTVQISAKGWDHPNLVLPAAALAAGTLMRLSSRQLVEAINLSLSGHLAMNQTRSQAISQWKGMAGAEAVRAGIFAAQLARAGIVGPAPIFEGTAGFFRLVSGDVAIDVGRFARAAGRFKVQDCAIKFYPAQAQTQTAILAAVKIGQQVGDLTQIASIEVATTALGLAYAANEKEKWAPRSSETADHSLPYIVARAMVDGEITPHSYDVSRLQDAAVQSLMAKLTVREDPALTAIYPEKIPNRVSVALRDGRMLSERVDVLPGFWTAPMRRSDLEDKFRRNARGVLAVEQQDRFLRLAWDLEKGGTVAELLGSLQVKGQAR